MHWLQINKNGTKAIFGKILYFIIVESWRISFYKLKISFHSAFYKTWTRVALKEIFHHMHGLDYHSRRCGQLQADENYPTSAAGDKTYFTNHRKHFHKQRVPDGQLPEFMQEMQNGAIQMLRSKIV